jgi:hypothetical protein
MRAPIALLLGIVACGPGGRAHTAPDASNAGGDATPRVCYAPSETGSVMAGNPDLQSCAIWNNVANMNGNVTLARDPANNLTMTFSTGLAFAGAITDPNVQLVHSELHDFTDGCKWRATETLSGTIDETTCVMMLHYAYVETVEISNGACASPCTGTADFTLQIMPLF